MACTIARERESGTLYQLLVTSLRRREIVIGKILPYLVVSGVLDRDDHRRRRLAFRSPLLSTRRAGSDLFSLFALFARARACSSPPSRALKRRRSSFPFSSCCRFLFFPARLPRSSNCPHAIRYVSEIFPLTHFCRAFRLVNMYHAGPASFTLSILSSCSRVH